MLPTQQILEQKRAKFAWERIREIQEHPPAIKTEYRTRALTFNQMVLTNGLGTTLGFLKSKASGKPPKSTTEPSESEKGSSGSLTAYGYLLKHLTDWMRTIRFAPDIPESDDGLLRWLLEATSHDYRRATTECLAFGIWLRRFAEAELPKGEKK